MRARDYYGPIIALALVILAIIACIFGQGRVSPILSRLIAPATWQLPSTTGRPEPVDGLPVGGPAEDLGDPDFLDTFDTDENWITFPPGTANCFSSRIADGKYWMTALGRERAGCWELTWPVARDFYAEVTIEMPEECEADDRFGLLFRAPDMSRGYLYGVTCGGEHSFNAWTGEETLQLLPSEESDLIRTGAGSSNRLGILAQGKSYAFYINGTKVAETSDGTFQGGGQLGFFVRAATTEGFTVAFDDLALWMLPGSTP